MKQFIGGFCALVLLAACGRNEPGTMGGEPGVPKSVATGAPGEAQEGKLEHDDPAIHLEKRHNTFDDAGADTNATGSSVGTGTPPVPGRE